MLNIHIKQSQIVLYAFKPQLVIRFKHLRNTRGAIFVQHLVNLVNIKVCKVVAELLAQSAAVSGAKIKLTVAECACARKTACNTANFAVHTCVVSACRTVALFKFVTALGYGYCHIGAVEP